MPSLIQNARATQALIEEFDVKGRFKMLLDEVVVPVAITSDVRPTLERGATYQAFVFIPAVLAEQPAVIIAANPPRQAQVHLLEVRVRSPVEINFEVRTDDLSAPLVLTAPQDLDGVNRLDPLRPPSPLIAAAGTVPAPLGTVRDNWHLMPDVDVVIDLSDWTFRPGANQPGGQARMFLFGSAANSGLNLTLSWEIETVS